MGIEPTTNHVTVTHCTPALDSKILIIICFQDELYNATKRFVIMKEMNVTMAQCSPSVDFEDNVMTVKYVLM